MGDEKLDGRESQGLIHGQAEQIRQNFDSSQSTDTGGGDSAGRDVDKRQNTFIFNLLGADPAASISQQSIQELVAALAQVTDGQSVSRAYQESLPPDAEVSRPKATTLEGMVAQLEEFRKLQAFLQQIAADPTIPEAVRKQLDELRQQEGDNGQEKPEKDANRTTPSALQAYLQIVVRQERGSDNLVVNAWLIPDIAVTDPGKRYQPLDLDESRKGVSCQIEDAQAVLNRFLDAALEALDDRYYDQHYELTIEMFLPWEYLCRDVDAWKMTVDLGFEEEIFPLGTRYHVLVRSQERLSPKYLRNKRNQWLANWERVESRLSPSSMLKDDDFEHLNQMQTCDWADLQSRLELKLGLKVTCGLVEASKKELFKRIILAASPIAVWPRVDFCEEDTPEAQEREINQLLTSRPLRSLMNRIRQKRKDAYCASCSDSHIGSHLAILWEDPNRLTPDVQPQAQLKSPGQ